MSVCIPTFNYARYLSEAIESVLSQTFTDFELLIRDDCSSDATAEVVSAYAKQDSRIDFQVNSSNLGMVKNWNLCLAEARGEYVKYVFGDDLLASAWALERMVEVLDAHDDVSLVASARRIVDDESRCIDTWSHFAGEQAHARWDVIARCLLEDTNFVGEPTAVMFRKADSGSGFAEGYRQLVDLELWFRLLKLGSLYYIDDPLCSFRVHGKQQTKVNSMSGIHSVEMGYLLSEYIWEKDVGASFLDKELAVLKTQYRVAKACRRHSINFDAMLRAMGGWYGFSRFLVGLPAYSLTRMFRRFHSSLSKRIGRQHA